MLVIVNGLVTDVPGINSRTATSRFGTEVSSFCYPLHCLLHVLSGRQSVTMELTGITTMSDGKAGVAGGAGCYQMMRRGASWAPQFTPALHATPTPTLRSPNATTL